MAAVATSRTITTQDAIDAVWESILDGSFAGPGEAARALWPGLQLDPVSLDLLALEGLIAMAMQAKATAVRARNGGRIPWGAPHGKKFERYIALTWPFEGADGSQKPLGLFSRTDLSSLALRAGALEVSWRERKQWAIAADAALVEHGAATIERLPAPVLAELSKDAAAVFGRKS